MTAPTLINLPPPPTTPSDFGPGTPNSFTSTVALKDGIQGAAPPLHHGHAHTGSSASVSSTNTLDAERADRISRLAGLERVATLRGASQHLPQTLQNQAQLQQPSGYFDNASVQPHKSTVGSASASGSVGGRMTWASESEMNDVNDKMSESADQDDEISSAGMSDEGNASLVGFGETASSTVSGPTSTGGRGTTMSSATKRQIMQSMQQTGSPMEGVEDGASSTPGQDQAQRIVGDVMGESSAQQPLGDVRNGKRLGQFYFEAKH